MRILCLVYLCFLLAGCKPVSAQDFVPERTRPVSVSENAAPLVAAARDRLDALVVYDPSYVGIGYPNGDVPATMGVCTDVVIRSLRKAYGFDLQKAVHQDMNCLLYTSPSPRDLSTSRMPSSA